MTASPVVLDAGPLFDALVAQFVETIPSPEKKRHWIEKLPDWLQRDQARESYLSFLSAQKDLITSSHVIGEIQGLVSSRLGAKGDDLAQFWESSVNYLIQLRLDERLIRLLEIARTDYGSALIGRLGPEDVGVIELARGHGCALLTNDNKLLGSALEQNVDCKLTEFAVLPQRNGVVFPHR